MEQPMSIDHPAKKKRPHRATGNPRGRPKVHPVNFDEVVLDALRRRMNTTTRMVVPYWRGLVEEFHIGRNTLAKAIRALKEKGLIKKVYDQSVVGTDNSGSIYLVHEL